MSLFRRLVMLTALGALAAAAAPLPELFNERLTSVVAVEFFVPCPSITVPITVTG